MLDQNVLELLLKQFPNGHSHTPFQIIITINN